MDNLTPQIIAGLILIGGILGIVFIPLIIGRQVMKWITGEHTGDPHGNYFIGIMSLAFCTALLLGLSLGYNIILQYLNTK